MSTAPRRPAKRVAAKKAVPAKKAAAKKVAPRPRVNTKRDAKVLELRQDGASFAAIAKQLRIRSADEVADAYERALAATLPTPSADVRRAELDRIDEEMEPLWPKAMAGDAQAIAQLAALSIDRTRIAADNKPLPEAKKQEAGPVERATVHEISRLRAGDNQLAATAVVLARGVDESSSESSVAASTVARELRMTMATLRGLAGTASAPDDGTGKKPASEGTVVPSSRLETLREKAQDRERSRH